MSAANLLPDSALHSAPEVGDDACEPPTQPWHAPPDLLEALELEQELEDRLGRSGELELEAESFDYHDTIPAPPWLDEPDALEIPLFPAR